MNIHQSSTDLVLNQEMQRIIPIGPLLPHRADLMLPMILVCFQHPCTKYTTQETQMKYAAKTLF